MIWSGMYAFVVVPLHTVRSTGFKPVDLHWRIHIYRSGGRSNVLLQCVAVCCSVLQCVAVCCSVVWGRSNVRTFSNAPLVNVSLVNLSLVKHLRMYVKSGLVESWGGLQFSTLSGLWCKRAFYLCKRALCFHKRAQCFHKRTLHFWKRAVYYFEAIRPLVQKSPARVHVAACCSVLRCTHTHTHTITL